MNAPGTAAGPPVRPWVFLRPRDTVIVRDGRSFDAGSEGGTDARTVAPWPSTVAGALSTAFTVPGPERAGDDGPPVPEPQAVRGPVLARECHGTWEAYFPVPADLVVPDDGHPVDDGTPLHRLRPALSTEPAAHGPPAGSPARGPARSPDDLVISTDLDGTPETLLVPEDGKRHRAPGGIVRGPGLARYLADDLGALATLSSLDHEATAPLVPERRVGLARENRTAREGYLYSSVHLRPRDGWGFLVQYVDGPATAGRVPRGPVPLGGRSRVADVERARDMAWPARPSTFPGGRVLLYVVTPALWPDGWRPPLPDGVRLVGACVPDPLPVAIASPRRARRSGTSVRGTMTLRWAVPPGSVYLLRFAGDAADDRAAAWAAARHGAALGPALDPHGPPGPPGRDGSPGPDRTATAGFGVVLTGRWSPAAPT